MSAVESLFLTSPKHVVLNHYFGRGWSTDTLRLDDHKDTISPKITSLPDLHLNDDDLKTVIRRVLDGMLQYWTGKQSRNRTNDGRHWAAAAFAARTYFPEDKELYKKVLLTSVAQYGGYGMKIEKIAYDLVPNPTNETTLQDLINHLLKSGCTAAEVRTAWKEMVHIRFENKCLTDGMMPWWEGLTVEGKDLTEVVEEIARKLVMREMRVLLADGIYEGHDMISLGGFRDHMERIEKLIMQTGSDWFRKNEKKREHMEDFFSFCFAKGYAYMGSYVLSRFGEVFGFWNPYDKGSYETALVRLMRGGMALAEENHRWGIACAIAEYIGDTENADRFRSLARMSGHKIALKFGFDKPFDTL